jgi:hypothetical protein
MGNKLYTVQSINFKMPLHAQKWIDFEVIDCVGIVEDILQVNTSRTVYHTTIWFSATCYLPFSVATPC